MTQWAGRREGAWWALGVIVCCSCARSQAPGDEKQSVAASQASAEVALAPLPALAAGSTRVELSHEMTYRYDHPVRLAEQTVRLRPPQGDLVPTARYSLSIDPGAHSVRWDHDAFGNAIARITIAVKPSSFSVRVNLIADVAAGSRPLPQTSEPLGKLPFTYRDEATRTDLAPYLAAAGTDAELDRLIASEVKPGRSLLDFVLALNKKIAAQIAYRERAEPGVQTPAETLRLARGACRDSAWLLVQALRHVGIASRFVSGYLVDLAALSKDAPADALSLHAWCECYLPGTGWLGLDTTAGLPASLAHIPLAAAPSPEQTLPLEGMVERAKTELSFSMGARRFSGP